jgi:hypothetical protein
MVVVAQSQLAGFRKALSSSSSRLRHVAHGGQPSGHDPSRALELYQGLALTGRPDALRTEHEPSG